MYSDAIKDHDHKVVVARGKLSFLDRKRYQSDEVPSRRHALAEEILDIEEQAQAFKDRLLNPADIYESDKARKERKKFEGHPAAPDIRERILELERKTRGN